MGYEGTTIEVRLSIWEWLEQDLGNPFCLVIAWILQSAEIG